MTTTKKSPESWSLSRLLIKDTFAHRLVTEMQESFVLHNKSNIPDQFSAFTHRPGKPKPRAGSSKHVENMYNRNKFKGSFDRATINAVWQKAKPVHGYDSNYIRKDWCGAFIKRFDYGNTNSKYGWEIDHIKPVSKSGSDHINNLQPLQLENNRHKGDDFPHWSCKVKAA